MDEELNKDKDKDYLIYGGDDGSDPSSISISATI